jgi:hypothetical protein
VSDILADRRDFVAIELGNRADLSQLGANAAPSRIDNWIWQSYLELGMGYSFPEAEDSFTGQWQQNMDAIPYPPQYRAIKAIEFYFQNGTAVRINWKDMQYLRRYPASSASIPSTINPFPAVGPPSVVADYAQQIFVRPYCDQNIYNYILDGWLKPSQLVGTSSVTPPYVAQGTADIGATMLLVPDDWLEVIDYGAMMRGHASLGEVEKANALQNMLYGYNIPTTGKFVPGIIATKWTRRQAQAPYMDYGIQPRQAKRGYTSTQ